MLAISAEGVGGSGGRAPRADLLRGRKVSHMLFVLSSNRWLARSGS